jgi:hypothetical protein
MDYGWKYIHRVTEADASHQKIVSIIENKALKKLVAALAFTQKSTRGFK